MLTSILDVLDWPVPTLSWMLDRFQTWYLFLACCTLITPPPYISMNWQLCYACKNSITLWDVLMGPVPNQYLCHCMSIASEWFLHCMLHVTFTVSDIVQLKCDGTRWHTGWEVRGKLANGVGSRYPSHYLGTRCIQHYYRWCAHLGCEQSTELMPPLI